MFKGVLLAKSECADVPRQVLIFRDGSCRYEVITGNKPRLSFQFTCVPLPTKTKMIFPKLPTAKTLESRLPPLFYLRIFRVLTLAPNVAIDPNFSRAGMSFLGALP